MIEVDFEPEKEVWNVYELSDGSMLRIRAMLMKLYRLAQPPKEGGDQYNASFQNVMVVKRTSPKLKGPKSTVPLPVTNLDQIPKVEVQFSPLVEDWNVYRLETGDSLKVKLVASIIYRIRDKWDQFGDPFYVVSSTNVIQPVKRPVVT